MMTMGTARGLALAALVYIGCTSNHPDVIDGAETASDAESPDVRDTADVNDGGLDVGRDVYGEDPYCHHDCFGGLRCQDGVVWTLLRTPVPCSYWTGECPVDPTIEPTVCEHGCRKDWRGDASVGDPMSMCQPCEDPTKTGPACDQCADPKRTGPDCATCIDPEKHGPECDLCLGGPGSSGCPCEEHEDCGFQVCLEGADGRRCAKNCNIGAPCPSGFVCSRKGDGYPSVCTPIDGYLCKVCEAETDCDLPGHWNAVCADFGLPEKRCTSTCYDVSCPEGFRCARIDYGRAQADVCVPQPLTACE